jgi:hypothetical protein
MCVCVCLYVCKCVYGVSVVFGVCVCICGVIFIVYLQVYMVCGGIHSMLCV